MNALGSAVREFRAQLARLQDRVLEILGDLLDPGLLVGDDRVAAFEVQRRFLELLLERLQRGLRLPGIGMGDTQLCLQGPNAVIPRVPFLGAVFLAETAADRRQDPPQQECCDRNEDQVLGKFDEHRPMIIVIVAWKKDRVLSISPRSRSEQTI